MADQTLTEEQQDHIAFISLVAQYQQIAWMAMGKIANPATNAVERQLDHARWAIDMLAMLERRTKGNLMPEESRMLREILYTLRMNYVEEAQKPAEPAPEKKPETPETPEEKQPAEPNAGENA